MNIEQFDHPVSQRCLRIAHDGRWFTTPDGSHVDLSRRQAMQRMLRRLLDAHVRAPNRPVSVAELVDAGWPGERMFHRSGVRRVYTEIGRMRDLGLRDALRHQAEGYYLRGTALIIVGEPTSKVA